MLLFEFELLELFELVLELLFELLFELVFELLFEFEFELVFEFELLDEFDELLPKYASLTTVSVAIGICEGAARTGSTGVACAAPAASALAATMVRVYFMTDHSIVVVRRSVRAMHLKGNEASMLGENRSAAVKFI